MFIEDAHCASCFFAADVSLVVSRPPCSALLPLDSVGMDRSKRKEKWENDRRTGSSGRRRGGGLADPRRREERDGAGRSGGGIIQVCTFVR